MIESLLQSEIGGLSSPSSSSIALYRGCERCSSLPHSCLSGYQCLPSLHPLETLTHPSAKETKVSFNSQETQ